MGITIHYTIKTKVKTREKAYDLLDIWEKQAEKSKTFAEVVSFDKESTDFPMKLCEIIGTEIKDYSPLVIAGFNLYLSYADCEVFQICLNKFLLKIKLLAILMVGNLFVKLNLFGMKINQNFF